SAVPPPPSPSDGAESGVVSPPAAGRSVRPDAAARRARAAAGRKSKTDLPGSAASPRSDARAAGSRVEARAASAGERYGCFGAAAAEPARALFQPSGTLGGGYLEAVARSSGARVRRKPSSGRRPSWVLRKPVGSFFLERKIGLVDT